MRITWYGQAAFLIEAQEGRVFLDPFGQLPAGRAGMEFRYPPIPHLRPDLVLITHEHFDHNQLGVLDTPAAVVRSTAGRFSTPVGEVLAVAAEHDAQAGTQRGPNTIFRFELEGLRIAHFGDFGQSELRQAQLAALGELDLLLLPVGAGPTIGPDLAHEIALQVSARIVVPMHYRTPAVNFLEPPDEFLARCAHVLRLAESCFDTADLPSGPVCVVPSPPLG